jgi:hypothetical protein
MAAVFVIYNPVPDNHYRQRRGSRLPPAGRPLAAHRRRLRDRDSACGVGRPLEASYFNPRPINVSMAKASAFKDHIKVEIELRDTGYPGSTYTLLYDPDKDALLGFYYQAVQKQNFDVVFVRIE